MHHLHAPYARCSAVQVPLFGFIGRLDYQKGADLVLGAAPWLLSQDIQLICLGTGEAGLEVQPHSPYVAFDCPPHQATLSDTQLCVYI